MRFLCVKKDNLVQVGANWYQTTSMLCEVSGAGGLRKKRPVMHSLAGSTMSSWLFLFFFSENDVTSGFTCLLLTPLLGGPVPGVRYQGQKCFTLAGLLPGVGLGTRGRCPGV